VESGETIKITVPRDRVQFVGNFAEIDTGLPFDKLILALLKYGTSDKDAMAVMKDGKEKIVPKMTKLSPDDIMRMFPDDQEGGQ